MQAAMLAENAGEGIDGRCCAHGALGFEDFVCCVAFSVLSR